LLQERLTFHQDLDVTALCEHQPIEAAELFSVKGIDANIVSRRCLLFGEIHPLFVSTLTETTELEKITH
jgi:hypothetical protein